MHDQNFNQSRHGLIDLHHWIVTLWWKSFYWWKFHVIFLIFLAAVQKTQDGKKYQVAWTEEVKHAKSGDYEVNLYDDNGYSAMKRVLERGDDASSVKPLVTIMVNHPVSWTQCRNLLCGNFRIFLSFRFYVKSIFEYLEVLKMPFLSFLGLWNVWIWSISAFKKCKNAEKWIFIASKFVKMAVLRFWNPPEIDLT